MRVYTECEGPFNVVVVSKTPCPGGHRFTSAVRNSKPLSLEDAERWAAKITELVGEEKGDGAVGAYVEQCDCPRPFTREILAALRREQRRDGVPAAPSVEAVILPLIPGSRLAQDFWQGSAA